MQDPTRTAREQLKEMPDGVFNFWIKDIIAINGWPFATLDSPSSGNFERYFCGLSLHQVSELNWRLERVSLLENPFNFQATKDIEDMASCHHGGSKNQFEVPADSYPRFVRLLSYIEEHGDFPFPIALYRTPNGFHIFDGHHRLSALFTLIKDHKILPFDIECWIGEKPK